MRRCCTKSSVECREAQATVLPSADSSGLDDTLAPVQDVELLGVGVGRDVAVDQWVLERGTWTTSGRS
jgi:hypothetical protein